MKYIVLNLELNSIWFTDDITNINSGVSIAYESKEELFNELEKEYKR